eukprot:366341-Chlamydomonas_euryale.AAC.3
MMGSTRYDRIGCSVEVAFGRRRLEESCGSNKEGYQVWVLNNRFQGMGVEVSETSLLRMLAFRAKCELIHENAAYTTSDVKDVGNQLSMLPLRELVRGMLGQSPGWHQWCGCLGKEERRKVEWKVWWHSDA